jgi:hypothetical protein
MRTLYDSEEQNRLVAFLKGREYEASGVEYRLYVGPRDFSDLLESGDYGVGAGSPAWSFSANLPLRLSRRLRGAPVRLFADLGGISLLVFNGKLSLPVPSPDTYSTDLLAATPGALLSTNTLDDIVEFPGNSPRAILRDAFYRVPAYDRGRVMIPAFNSPILTFMKDTAFRDEDHPKTIIDAVAGIIDFSYYDTPHDSGVDVEPEPGTGEGRAVEWDYLIDSHEVFSFPEPKWATPDEQYTRVVVRDRFDDNSIRVWEPADVDYSDLIYPPEGSQTLYISWAGVSGSPGEARALAVNTARSLKRGSWTVDPIVAYNTLLSPGRPVTFAGEHEDDEGLWWRVWRCVILGMKNPVGEGVATQLLTRAVLLLEDRLPDPPIVLAGVSPGVAITPRVLFEFDGTGLIKNANIAKAITSDESGHYYDADESFGLIRRTLDGTFIAARTPGGGVVAIRESEVIPFGLPGVISTGPGRVPAPIRYPGRIFNLIFTLGGVADRDVIIDVLLKPVGGSWGSLFVNPANRPRILAGTDYLDVNLEALGLARNVNRGDLIDMELIQVGSGSQPGLSFGGSVEYSRRAA